MDTHLLKGVAFENMEIFSRKPERVVGIIKKGRNGTPRLGNSRPGVWQECKRGDGTGEVGQRHVVKGLHAVLMLESLIHGGDSLLL